MENGKVVQNSYPGPDDHQITSRGSPFADAYHVWWMFVTAIVRYPAHKII